MKVTRFSAEPQFVSFELTRRNLLVLLAKLDDPDSLRTIIDATGCVQVRAVEDQEHYADRSPGPMRVRGRIV